MTGDLVRYYLIRSRIDPALFWSDAGWGRLEEARRFTVIESEDFPLPVTGMWIRVTRP